MAFQHLEVLLVEDNPLDAELILRQLRKSGFAPACTRVETRDAFLAALSGAPDVIISDYSRCISQHPLVAHHLPLYSPIAPAAGETLHRAAEGANVAMWCRQMGERS